MNNKVHQIIQSVFPISKRSSDKINSLVAFKNVQKGEAIVNVEQPNNLEYFVLEGVQKSFLHNPDGEETTLSFFMSGSILPPFTTRVKDGRSLMNFKALTPGVLASFNANEFEKLMIEDLEIRNFGNTVLRNELARMVQKEIALASLPSVQRLELLRTTYPNLENLVPHTDIASYLGITPISLSRLRSKR